MAAREIVDYIINMGGNLTQGANTAATAVDRLGAAAKRTGVALANDLGKTAKSLNQNQLISQFETLASLLTQVGGNTAQFGIIASSAARPVYLLSTVVGGAGLAMLAIPAAGAAAALGIRAMTNAAEGAVETLQKMNRIDLISTDQLHALRDYRTAADDLTASLTALKLQAGAAAAPVATRMAGAGSLLLSGDQEAWGLVLQQMTSPGGMGAPGQGVYEKLQKMAQDKAAQAASDAQARAERERMLDMTRRQMEDEEKKRKDSANRAGAAITAADAERAKIARESASKMKEAQRAVEAERDALLRANEAILDEYNAARKLFEKTPGGQVLSAIEDVRNGLPGSSIFEDGESIPDLEEKFFAQIRGQMEIDPTVRYYPEGHRKAGQVIPERALRDPGFNARMMGTAGSIVGGADVGSIVSAAGGGPIGMILGAVSSGAAGEALEGLFDQVKSIYTDLPKQIGKIVGDIVPDMVRQAPEMASAFLVLAPAIAIELVKAAPELFGALLEATLNAPFIIADAILALPSEIAKALEEAPKKFLESLNPFDRVDNTQERESRAALLGAIAGGIVGGPMGAVAGASAGLGIDRLAHGRGLGGNKGSGQASRRRGGPSIGTMVVVSPNPREHVRQLRQLQGSYGYGYDLDPAAV